MYEIRIREIMVETGVLFKEVCSLRVRDLKVAEVIMAALDSAARAEKEADKTADGE